MTNRTSEGTESARRITNYTANFRPMPSSVPELEVQETEADRVRRVLGANQEQQGEDDDPITTRQFIGMLLMGLASWEVVGGAFYGAFKLSEVLR